MILGLIMPWPIAAEAIMRPIAISSVLIGVVCIGNFFDIGKIDIIGKISKKI